MSPAPLALFPSKGSGFFTPAWLYSDAIAEMAKGNTELGLELNLESREKDGASDMCLFQTAQPRGEH